MKKNLPIIILIVLIIVGGLYLFIANSKTKTATNILNTSQISTTTAQLAIDLANVTSPQFVDDKSLAPELQKIKEAVKTILYPDGPVGGDITLIAVGKRYVVASIPSNPDNSIIKILDSVTLESNYISGLFQFKTDKIAVYVSATDICTYTLDQPSCIGLPGAKLSGGEIYGDDETLGGYFIPQDETHTNTSLTIAVLKWVPNPEKSSPSNTVASNVLKKVRDVTFVLP